MNSKRQEPGCNSAAQRKSRISRIPLVRTGPCGRGFSFRQLPPEREMGVPAYRISSLIRSEHGNLSRCNFSFYITGRALVLRSISWESRSNKKRNFVDAASCKTILKILDEFAARHKATTLYSSRHDIPLPMLLNLGFRPANMRDFMQREAQKVPQNIK
ncbi:hypothetical protein GF415_03435 [Candidatus Micrarchaeota archaeon]|nr:hypothetical protein [Candidatus Micrarchaeota archaeon]